MKTKPTKSLEQQLQVQVGEWASIPSSQGSLAEEEEARGDGSKLVRYASASMWPNLTCDSVVRCRWSPFSSNPLASMHTTFGRLILSCDSLTFSMYLPSPETIATCLIHTYINRYVISSMYLSPSF